MEYKHTGKFYIEVSEYDIDNEVWEAITTRNPESNLCDLQPTPLGNDYGDCDNSNIYITDDAWAMTHYCPKHFKQTIEKGHFEQVTKPEGI